MLPAAIRDRVATVLGAPIISETKSAGGDISEAIRLETTQGTWLLKWNAGAPADFFAAEADGLATLRTAAILPVPAVRAYAAEFIVLEWFEPRGRYDPAMLGTRLAQLHSITSSQYGYGRDNFVGALPQLNSIAADWAIFWRDYRLMPQVQRADQSGRLNAQRARRLDRLIARVPELLTHRPAAALLHGDLWAGNVITAPDGQPALIDPAVSYGDRETDLAFAALFGGFDERFFAAYEAASPLPFGATQRRPLYQLYWLLVHLTLFGESYGPMVDRVVAHYG